MAVIFPLTYWGLSPSATTVVNGSPSPTVTQFNIVSALGFWAGQEITVNGSRTTIQSVVGNQLNVLPALPSISAGNVVSAFAQLITNKKLNEGWEAINTINSRPPIYGNPSYAFGLSLIAVGNITPTGSAYSTYGSGQYGQMSYS